MRLAPFVDLEKGKTALLFTVILPILASYRCRSVLGPLSDRSRTVSNRF
jgi:hypothetical protein